ncbi:MAG TPA: dihydropteroate synthase [Syntrophorhabdaceae bacterium]|nr:dihydropteroate synthase [Syntrophorhabdaceae bacterium]
MARKLLSKKLPLIMGILNVTPDSFFDGGHHSDTERAFDHAMSLISDGADIIDVGGESTRPNAEPVDKDEELNRVIPVIERIRASSDVLISIDTYKSDVAREACRKGADIINDISGLTFDPAMAGTAAEAGAFIVIMHIKGTPRNMQKEPYYDDVINEICNFFKTQMKIADGAGINDDRIILDPGIGFGKRVEDNLKILKLLREFKKFDKPLLVGASMKSFIGHVTGAPVEDRSEGSLASNVVSLMNGADILRVHNVKQTVEASKLVRAIMES